MAFYMNHLNHFVNFTTKHLINDVEEINDSVISDYIFHMKETCENVTINKNIGCIKRMYRDMKIDFPYLQQVKKAKRKIKNI